MTVRKPDVADEGLLLGRRVARGTRRVARGARARLAEALADERRGLAWRGRRRYKHFFSEVSVLKRFS